jgi:hypothetical protein
VLRRSPASPSTIVAVWLLALAGCGALAGYALSRPAGALTHAVAVVDAGALLAVGVLAGRLLPRQLPAPLGDVTAPLLVGLLLATRPVRDAVLAGQLTICAVALVLYAVTARRRWHTDAIALGLAIGVTPAWALFAILLCRGGRRATAMTALGIGAAITALTWRIDGGPWLTRLSGPLPSAAQGHLDDVSVRGMLLRLGLSGSGLLVCWLVVIALVVVMARTRADRYARDDQPLLALGVLGSAAVAATPVAWSYDLIWLLAAAAGRLGRRAEDRPVWPIVAIVPTLLSSAMFDPKIDAVTGFALRNSPGLLAVLAATLLPFALRSDRQWRVARVIEPTSDRPFGRRWLPLLPTWLHSMRRPNLLLELLVIQVGYGIYTWIRNVAPNRAGEAVSHGQDVFHVERFLHLDIERSLNQWVVATDWLTDALEHYYKTLHFAVPLAVLAWLYWRRPDQYRPARTVLFTTTGLALIGFWAYPLAPPRLTPGHGFGDSLHPDSHPFGAFTSLTNQFAAMPSLHIGWATWCALVLVITAPYLWVRILGGLYPVVTLLVVLGTANHWLLDAAAAVVTLLIAYVVQYLLTGQHIARTATADRAAAYAADPARRRATHPRTPWALRRLSKRAERLRQQPLSRLVSWAGIKGRVLIRPVQVGIVRRPER